ncbi:MAG: serine/threonine-protein phosphatase [Actinobacteria bacterium]|nr:MAG: serine/threonine-protein phosphatase [Actinomycetota bacterium]
MLRVAEDHFSDTHTGRQRRANEDAYFARAPLFVVADGMGGAQAGEVASGMAVELFADGLPDGGGGLEQRLAAVVREANDRIYRRSRSDSAHAGMGTTLTAAYVGDDEISIAHVGDSRAYCLRDGKLMRLTRDHSLVDELISSGRLTPEEAEHHPQRSVITRALGPTSRSCCFGWRSCPRPSPIPPATIRRPWPAARPCALRPSGRPWRSPRRWAPPRARRPAPRRHRRAAPAAREPPPPAPPARAPGDGWCPRWWWSWSR